MSDVVITEDGSGTLGSERYGETYHSTNGALTEAQHVFLDASGVSDRLRQGLPTRVLEIGFGLGLNTLLTADMAMQYNVALDYHSIEHDLLNAKLLASLDYGSLLANNSLVGLVLDGVSIA